MKKFVLLIVVAFFLAIAASSCRSSKPPCPAYQAQNAQSVQMHDISR